MEQITNLDGVEKSKEEFLISRLALCPSLGDFGLGLRGFEVELQLSFGRGRGRLLGICLLQLGCRSHSRGLMACWLGRMTR